MRTALGRFFFASFYFPSSKGGPVTRSLAVI